MPFVLLLLVGLTHLLQLIASRTAADPLVLFHRFLPPHLTEPGRDPFALVEGALTGIIRNRGTVSLYAVPAFIWFSTRLFAGIRVSLNDVFDVTVRPPPPRNFLVAWLFSKLRDAGMVVATVLLFLVNAVITVGLAIAQSQGVAYLPQLSFAFGWLGRSVAEVAALVFSISLFFVTYKYASVRKLPWRTALLASMFTALAFEIAKRLYGLYLARFASLQGAGGDANIGAAVLFVLWIYYTAIVFLLGGVVAETWELRRMQRRQRAILT